jgi:hypothetical protein
MPIALAECLLDQLPSVPAADRLSVHEFANRHVTGDATWLLNLHLSSWRTKVRNGESRHCSVVGHLVGAMKEARAGLYPARLAIEQFKATFVSEVQRTAIGPNQSRARNQVEAYAEWNGLLAWAVAQANASSLEEVHNRVAGIARATGRCSSRRTIKTTGMTA